MPRAGEGAVSVEHLFRYDLERSDVTVTHETADRPRGGLTFLYRDAPTLTCAQCGLRLAHISAPNGRVSAAYGVELDALVRTGKKLPACKPFGSAEGVGGLADLARRESGHG